MNSKTTLILLAFLLVVGAFFIVLGPGEAPDDQPGDRLVDRGAALLPAGALGDAVARIDVEHEGQKLVLSKSGAQWWQTQPVRFPLSQWSADELVRQASDLRYAQKFTPGAKGAPTLEDTGLAPQPSAVVTFTTRPGASESRTLPVTHVIKLGKRAIGGQAYAMLDDDPAIYVVNEELHRAVLEQGIEAWRERSITAPAASGASRVTVTLHRTESPPAPGSSAPGSSAPGSAAPGNPTTESPPAPAGGTPPTTLDVIKHDGAWAFAPPLRGRVSAAALDGLLNGMRSANISKFIKDADPGEDLSAYGLDRPTAVITVTSPIITVLGTVTSPASTQPAPSSTQPTSVSQSVTLTIGAPVDLKKESYFATLTTTGPDAPSPPAPPAPPEGGTVVFTLPRSTLEALTKKPDDLRDARLSILERTDVHDLTIEHEPDVIHLVKEPSGWVFDDPKPAFRADSALAAGLVDAITAARASAYREDAKPAGEPLAEITLVGIGRAEPDVLRVYKGESEKELLVLRNAETVGYIVDAGALEGVFRPAMAMRDRTVLDLHADQLTTLEVRRADGVAYTFTREIKEPATTQATQPAKPGPWQLKGGGELEPGTVETLASLLTPLKAQRWDFGASSPGKDEATVIIDTTDWRMSGTQLRVDLRSGKALLTLNKADSAVTTFIVGQPLIEALSAEYRGRLVLPIAAEDIESVTITRGQEVTAVRKNLAGRYESERGVEFDQSAAGALMDALAGLRVERYVKAPEPAPAVEMTVAVKVRKGEAEEVVTLTLSPAEGPMAEVVRVRGTVDGREVDEWCVLSEATLAKLRADLMKPAPPEAMDAPPGMPMGNFPGGFPGGIQMMPGGDVGEE